MRDPRRASSFDIRHARQQLLQMEEDMRRANEEEQKKKKDAEAKEKEKEKEKETLKGKKGKEKLLAELARGHEAAGGEEGDEAARERAIIKGLYGNLRLEELDTTDESEGVSENDGDDEGEGEGEEGEGRRMVPVSRIKRMQREEKYFIKAICALRDKLDDANLRIMNKAMKEVLSFYQLIQLSDALISSVANEAKDLLKTKGLRNPSLACLAISLLQEVCLLMHRCNDFSVGINQPTLEKLEAFKKKFAAKESAQQSAAQQQQHGRRQAQQQQQQSKGGSGGFFSFFK